MALKSSIFKNSLKRKQSKMRIVFAFLPLFLSGCFQNNANPKAPSASSSSSTTSGNLTTTTAQVGSTSTVYYASQVTAAAPAAASSGTPSTSTSSIATLLIDPAKSSGAISNSCSMAAAKTCDCIFSWKETNASGGINTEIDRVVKTKMTNAQPYLISCTLPAAYTNEIIEGTSIKINLLASGVNSSVFTLKNATLVKTGTTLVGDFQYLQGQAFDDVLRYTCHDMTQKALNLTNKRGAPQTHPRTNQKVETLLANQFCFAQAGAAPSADCGKPIFDYSSQAYYYNLYIRNTDRGNINLEAAGFKCPQVKEPIRGGSLSVGDQKNFYPLDSTFALALKNSNDFTIGVEAFTKIANTDAGSQGSTCSSGKATSAGDTPSAASGTGGLISSCLGFAAKPSSDGTCPSLKDSKTGQYRNTYRLRRFIAVYPPIFDATGKMLKDEAQRTDTTYVLDRPVNSTLSDPLKPFTMRGPKPCPFAYFDAHGVTGDPDDPQYVNGMPMYVGTSNAAWNGVNVDGTQFPNYDFDQKSCSSAMYLLNDAKDTVTIGTVHKSNAAMKRVYIRPARAWTPHFEEDTSFQACAPQASDYRDPPLHFSKDSSTGNVSWCAEAYPTQNPNVTELDRKTGGTTEEPWGGVGPAYIGKVSPYTSHSVKNSMSATCVNTSIVSLLPNVAIYPSTSEGYHLSTTITDSFSKPSTACSANNSSVASGASYCVLNATQTCDRTVMSKSTAWSRYPLLARPAQVEQSIATDSTYGCIMSYDANNGKLGKKSPAKGCCGNSVKVWTGLSGSDNLTNRTAHLEPDTACLVPDYN